MYSHEILCGNVSLENMLHLAS